MPGAHRAEKRPGEIAIIAAPASSPVMVVRYDLARLQLYFSIIKLRAPPSLVYQEGQVMDPIGFTNPTWVENVTQVVFRIRDNKIGMRD